MILAEIFQIQDTNLFHLPNFNRLYNEGTVNKSDGVVAVRIEDCKSR